MTFPQLLSLWREADRLGYAGASLYDLLAAPCLECWTALTALTALTSRLRPAPLVLAWDYRHPAVLAKMAATLDALSGGRLVLGVGAGGSRDDHEASGLPWRPLAERLARLEDGLRLMRFLWSGQEGEFVSRFYGRVRGPGEPRPAQAGGPPVLIGGHGRRLLLRTVARAADLCNVGFDLSPEEWAETKALLARYCQEEGRHPAALGLSHNATVLIGGNDAAVEAARERYRPRSASVILGTPERCIAQLQRYVELGVTWFFLLFPGLPEDRAGLRLFARAVLPAFGPA